MHMRACVHASAQSRSILNAPANSFLCCWLCRCSAEWRFAAATSGDSDFVSSSSLFCFVSVLIPYKQKKQLTQSCGINIAVYKCRASCLATQTPFAKNGKNNNAGPRELVPDINSSVQMNFLELVVNGASPDFVPPVVCFQIHLLSWGHPDSGGSTPRGTGDMIPLKWEVRGVGLSSTTVPASFGGPLKRFPPLLLITKSTSFAKDAFILKGIFAKTLCCWEGKGKAGLVPKKWDEKGPRDMGAGHQEVWIALMKDAKR